MGGWSEDWRVMLNSTQDQVEVEVRVELGNKAILASTEGEFEAEHFVKRIESKFS